MKNVIIADPVLSVIGRSDTLFGRGGIKVYPARTSEEILELHRKHTADLIVTDSRLPVMGGAQLCAMIRADVALRGVSLIMTCEASEVKTTACGEVGANAVIAKPIDPFELFSRISELLVIPRRQDIRTFVQVAVAGQKDKTTFLGMSHNISISGMLIETEQELESDNRLVCTLKVGGRDLVVEAKVVRRDKSSSTKTRYGVKFTNLDTKTMIILEQLVKGNIKH